MPAEGNVRPHRCLVIANPGAGLRRRSNAGEAATGVLAGAGCRVELRRTERPGDAQRWASQAAEAGFDLVVAEGGDGTVNEVANGVASTNVAVAVAPAGTMNLLARVLGLPLRPDSAIARIVDGYRPLRLRPGSANGRQFLLMLGAGFDAWVLRELVSAVRAKIGFMDYTRGAIRGLGTFPFPSLTIAHDGRLTSAHTAIVGRAPLYGGFLRPTPHVRLETDGLELCAFSGGAFRLAMVLPRLWSGAHVDSRGVTLSPARSVAITASNDDIPYQVDGELAGILPVSIGLAERMLVLATPRRIS